MKTLDQIIADMDAEVAAAKERLRRQPGRFERISERIVSLETYAELLRAWDESSRAEADQAFDEVFGHGGLVSQCHTISETADQAWKAANAYREWRMGGGFVIESTKHANPHHEDKAP